MDYQQFADEHHLKIDIEDRVAILRLDRPEKRNAVNFALHDGLERIFRPLGTDPDVGAIVITGEGKASVRVVTWSASIPMTRVPST